MTTAETQFRPRLQSDPELPHLLPLPARPSSSDGTRPPFIEPHRFTDNVVAAMAKMLNISSDNLLSLGWVVRDCLLQLQDEDWDTRYDEKHDSISFINKTSGETRSIHETVLTHQKLVTCLIHEKQESALRRTDRNYLAREIVLNAARSATDIRAAVTPRVLTKLLSLFKIDPSDEPFLIPRFITLLRQAFFACKSDPSITNDRIFSTAQFLVQLAHDRWNYIMEISPWQLIYCVDCTSRLADGICAKCGDCQCNHCFGETHKSGNRSLHVFVAKEQAVCAECTLRGADIRCTDCQDFFCCECFENLHQLGKTVKHGVVLAKTAVCAQCDNRDAALVCMQCQDVICRECAGPMHQRGGRSNHDLFSLRKVAYSQRLFAGNFKQVVKIRNRNMTASLPVTLWYLFFDEALQPFWLNLKTSEIIKTTMRDLQTRPKEEISERCRNFASAAAVLKGPGPLRLRFGVKNENLEIPKNLEISAPVMSDIPDLPDLPF